MSQTEDVKRVSDQNGATIDASARITNVLPPVDASDVATKGSVEGIADNLGYLKIVEDEIDAMSARIKDLGDASMTNQGDAINVGTLTEQFPALMAVDVVGVDVVTITIDTLTLEAVQGMASDVSDALNALQEALAANHVLDINT
jgi:hypothetical protein